MKRLIERIVEGCIILALVYLLVGCAMIDGAASDLAWTADKMSEAIVVPE